MTGRVVSVWTKAEADGEASTRQDAIDLVEGMGVRGDRHYNERDKPLRQILLVDQNNLNDLGLEEGSLREQVTVDMPGLQDLPIGSVLEVGGAAVEITMDCAPCRTMAGYLGEQPQAFVNRAMRKRGMLGRILQSGTVSEGDEVRLRGSED
jgi:MOSC domain-containing protein YiiM